MSDLEKRNNAAILDSLNKQNKILAEYGNKLNDLATEVVRLNSELQAIKQKHIQDLVDQMGSGPTV